MFDKGSLRAPNNNAPKRFGFHIFFEIDLDFICI